MTMPTNPTNRSADDALEARLAATFDRATQRAATDIAQGDVVLQRHPRPSGLRRLATRPTLVAGFAVLALALSLGVLRLNPTTSTAASSATPVVQPSTSTPPSVSAPPTTVPVNNAVYPVGSGAAERIAASVDRTDFVISGWIVGAPAPTCVDGSAWDPCHALLLHTAPGGGPSLAVARLSGLTTPAVDLRSSRWVTVRVHTHDATCADASCTFIPALDGFVEISDQQPITLPDPSTVSTAVTREQALAVAAKWSSPSPIDFLLVDMTEVVLGTSTPNWPEVDATRVAWDVSLRPAGVIDGNYTEHVAVDAVTGQVLTSWNITSSDPLALPSPAASIPTDLAGVPVLVENRASEAIGLGTPTSFLVGGWLQGLDRAVCNPAGPATSAWSWDPCSGVWLHPAAAGGTPLTLRSAEIGLATTAMPPSGEVVPVVLRVHLEAGTLADGTATLNPVADAVVWLGTHVGGLALGNPTDGVTRAEAEKAGAAYRSDKNGHLLFGSRITLSAFEAITGSQLSSRGVSQDSWVWLLVYSNSNVSPDLPSMVVVALGDGRPLLGASSFP